MGTSDKVERSEWRPSLATGAKFGPSLRVRRQRRGSRLLIFLLVIPWVAYAFSRLWCDPGMQSVRPALAFASGVTMLLVVLSLVGLLLRPSPKRESASIS